MTILSNDRTALLAVLERFPRQRVIMLGDLVADESVYGEIVRVSREAPVLILKQREKQIVPGRSYQAVHLVGPFGERNQDVGGGGKSLRCGIVMWQRG